TSLCFTIEYRPALVLCTDWLKPAGDSSLPLTMLPSSSRVRESSPCCEQKTRKSGRSSPVASIATCTAIFDSALMRRRCSDGMALSGGSRAAATFAERHSRGSDVSGDQNTQRRIVRPPTSSMFFSSWRSWRSWREIFSSLLLRHSPQDRGLQVPQPLVLAV